MPSPVGHESGVVLYRRLLGFAKPYRTAFIVAVIGMTIMAATEAGMTALIKPMLDGSFVNKDPQVIRIIPFAIIGIFIIRGISSFVSDYSMNWVGRNVVRDMREHVFAHLLILPASYFDHTPSGQLTSKLIYDVEQVAQATTNVITITIRDSLMVLALLSWMLYLSWLLSLFFLGVAPLLALTVAYVSKRFRRYSRRIQDSMVDVTRVTHEAINAQRVVKTYGGQAYEAMRFAQANNKNRVQHMKMAIVNAIAIPLNQLIGAFAFAAVLFVATQDNMLDQITVGTFMSFITSLSLLFVPIKRLTSVNQLLQKGIAAAQSIFSVLDEVGEADHGTQKLTVVDGKVEFNNVFFAYAKRSDAVLKNISFTVEAGKNIALVGRSGSGKSTLVNLLPRFYNCSSGNITIDGQDITNVALNDLRKHIALVSQDISLFNDTIYHNIAYGRLRELNKSAVIDAAKAAHALDFINELPQQFETQVGEHGVLLSGGQRQRIAIARAILKNAPILILDEATSALDTESERHIQAALEELMATRTTLIIAHRLSTIENADKILVLNEGSIVECGNHRELLAKNGIYANLHNMQFRDNTAIT